MLRLRMNAFKHLVIPLFVTWATAIGQRI